MRSTISDGWNSSNVTKIGTKEGKTPIVFGKKLQVLHQGLEHSKGGYQLLCCNDMVEAMSNLSPYFDFLWTLFTWEVASGEILI